MTIGGRRVRGWHVYVALLVASQLVILLRASPRSDPPQLEHQVVPCQTAAGPEAGEVTIAYRDQGAGEPVIYLHGSPGSAGDAARLMPLLASRFRVLSLDLPGFGSSSRWVADYGIRAHARYVLAFMDALGFDRAHLIGHSMGGGVALEASRLQTQRVASITMYGGIGVQEGEGSGDYYYEHLKYGVGYLALVVAPELVPHFGMLGPRAGRHAFIRNFWDTDQRPLRDALERTETPLLIVHGRDDPLVPAETAEEHHRIVPHSELVMLDASHFLVFSVAGSRTLAEEILPFLERHRDPGIPPRRRTVDSSAGPRVTGPLGARLSALSTVGPWLQSAVLALFCFPLGHLTCLVSGLLARELIIDVFVAMAGCYVGVVASDVALFAVGRWLRRHPGTRPAKLAENMGRRFGRHVGWTVLLSRLVPGMRWISHPALGRSGCRPWVFVAASATSAVATTTVLVGLGIAFGPALAEPIESWLHLA